MDFNFDFGFGSVFNAFSFVILIILITSGFSWLKTRARLETIKELARAGHTIDENLLRKVGDLDDDEEEGDGRGMVTAGLILVAVAIGLIVLGRQIGVAEGDEEIFPIMIGVAAFPFMIGIVILVSGIFRGRSRREE